MALEPEDVTLVWARYGVYADRLAQDGKKPLPFTEWLIEQQRLAGEQQDLF